MRIQGRIVRLRPARESDRRDVYSWLARSDVTASMMGQPVYPDAPPPTWDEFCADYGPHFFDGSAPGLEASYIIEVSGEPVGHVNYEVRDTPVRHAELDIWLRSEGDTGHGYGPDALAALTGHLRSTLGIGTFLLRPSARNRRAIRAYRKAGFTLVPMTQEQQAEMYGPGDYDDSVVLLMERPVRAVPKVLPESLTPDLIAPCGMDCGLCRGHLREKNRCPGCNGDDAAKPRYCVTCKIKTCGTIASGAASFCFECDSFPCARLRQLDKRYRTKYGMSMTENLLRIREIGAEAFVDDEKRRWACPACGSLLCVHLPRCGVCGRPWNPSGPSDDGIGWSAEG